MYTSNKLNLIGMITIAVIGFCLLTLSPAFAAINTENITALWLFDEGEGTTATDSSGNGNDGTIHGATWVDGKFGQALEFNGTDNWVEVPHSQTVSFEAGTSFSLTVHFKGTKVGGSLAGKNYEDTTQVLPWYMLWNGGADNKVTFFLRNSASQNYRPISTTEIGDDQWHFIAGVADADSAKVSLWVDGVKEAEVDYDTASGYGTGEGVFHIGRHFNRYTAGIIDEVVLFNTALSEADLQTVMNDGLAALTAVEAEGKIATTWGSIKKRSQ